MKRILLLISVMVLFVNACNKEESSDFQLNISAEKCRVVIYRGDERDGRMIKPEDSDRWFCSDFPYRLKGFDCKEGYEYKLLIRQTNVKTNPNSDPSPYYCSNCILINIISMTRVYDPDEL
jgi:hypothetical protein